MAAQVAARRVIASAKRFSEFRQCCPVTSSTAEMKVPACPMPIHQTVLEMAMPQLTGMLMPQTPTPLKNSQKIDTSSIATRRPLAPSTASHAQPEPGGCRTAPAICAVTPQSLRSAGSDLPSAMRHASFTRRRPWL